MLPLIWVLALSACYISSVSAEVISATRQNELRYLLIQDCGSCHGLTMHGGLGPALLPENMKQRPRDSMIDTVLFGREGTAMPPWAPLLSRDEAAWIIDQLREGIDTP